MAKDVEIKIREIRNKECIIQITGTDNHLIALTNYGRIFRQEVEANGRNWRLIDSPNFKEFKE